MTTIETETIKLIDGIKSVCKDYGLGNDPSQYKVITQVFLYKILNDKFSYEVKRKSEKLASAGNEWERVYKSMGERERTILLAGLDENTPILMPDHLISNLWSRQDEDDFHITFDNTMLDIAKTNSEIFSTQTTERTEIPLFDTLTDCVTDKDYRKDFASSLVKNLITFSFESFFGQNYDFFAKIFEYLIKDYNTAGGGTYAEYYTPLSVATIMARLLVGNASDLHNIKCYDPSAGTGTLLMALSHQIGEKCAANAADKCSIYAQDISQKSNRLLKLNLILNGLVGSLHNVVQGDTLVSPYHKSDDGESCRKFDYVVSNPPFKMDFSGTRDKIESLHGSWIIPDVPNKDIDKMPVYTCFIQHVIDSLKPEGKAAIVVPTSFLTARSGPEGKTLRLLFEKKLVYGCISMPPNIFANTNTGVSVLFLHNSKSTEDLILIDATKLGEEYREKYGEKRIKKRRLRNDEIDKIVNAFLKKETIEDFSVLVTYKKIEDSGKYVLAPGHHFDVKIKYVKLSKEEFDNELMDYQKKLDAYFEKSSKLQGDIMEQIDRVKHGEFNQNGMANGSIS